MPPTHRPGPPRRAPTPQRSFDSILDAAVDALAGDPEASMAEIARRAGVVRATIYVHFPTREALIDAVTERAVAEVTEVDRGRRAHRGDARDALERVVAAAWSTLGPLPRARRDQHPHCPKTNSPPSRPVLAVLAAAHRARPARRHLPRRTSPPRGTSRCCSRSSTPPAASSRRAHAGNEIRGRRW